MFVEVTSLPGPQMWSPIIDMGISTLQLEHLMVGKKLDARVVDAMFAFHLFSNKCRATECSFLVPKHAALRFRAACPPNSSQIPYPL